MNIEKIGILLKRVHFGRLALALILVNLVVLLLVVNPQRNSIATLQGQYASLRQLVATDQREVKGLNQRVELLQKAQSDLKQIYAGVLLPRKEGFLAVRLELEDLVRKMQIKRDAFSYTYKDLPDLKLQLFQVGVPVEGNYRNIRRFINSIERSEHFLILDRVDLSSENKGDSLNLDFMLSTYLVMDEKQ